MMDIYKPKFEHRTSSFELLNFNCLITEKEIVLFILAYEMIFHTDIDSVKGFNVQNISLKYEVMMFQQNYKV